MGALVSTMPGRERLRIRVRGSVQGVGFRPFVYRRASELGVAGWVANTAEGVTIEAEGALQDLDRLLEALRHEAPAHATVAEVRIERTLPRGEPGFVIRTSETGGPPTTAVLPDLATCRDCLHEVFDPANRRYLYPFTNCTACGPRFSIIEDLPYDRARTTMRGFAMCRACRAEYEDPLDRRFHAEPNACPECGPQLALWDTRGASLAVRHEALETASDALRGGLILAVKGLGGFHLMVDARDEQAVARLRARKRREEKPLALMFPSPADVMRHCEVASAEMDLLASRAAPIVLLRRAEAEGVTPVATAVAPHNPYLGCMLPYTPLHHLLMRALGFPVVATSGNLSDEPMAIDERDALRRLAGIADLFLVHDRPIVRVIDDSLVRLAAGRPMLLRHARGHAPAPVASGGFPDGMLAVGGHLKTTVALTTGGAVVLSQHIGDLDTAEARDAHGRTRASLERLYRVRPAAVVADLHPDYASTRFAFESGLPVTQVQHHVAHVAACMAEHDLEPPALGVAWDGTGYGADGTVWGGEFLLVTGDGFERVAHLRHFRLPGGEAAVREPRRAALGLLHEGLGETALEMRDLAPVAAFAPRERAVLGRMLAGGINAPWTSSAGRLFDAVAALLGIRQETSYEGQAASELEWAISTLQSDAHYPLELRLGEDDTGSQVLILDWEPALRALLADIRSGTAPAAIAAAFHNGLACAIVDVAARVGAKRVALSGGCFQNRYLMEGTVRGLCDAGFEPYWHERVPPNDGGLALGQIAWAARRQRGSMA
jgi:hydrogenase maturation protein HypF